MARPGRPREPGSFRQRAKKLGIAEKTLRLREDPVARRRHSIIVKKYYKKNRELCIQRMTEYSVKRSGRIICKVCRHKYDRLREHLTRFAEKGDTAHYKELQRIYGTTYPDAFISAKEQVIN